MIGRRTVVGKRKGNTQCDDLVGSVNEGKGLHIDDCARRNRFEVVPMRRIGEKVERVHQSDVIGIDGPLFDERTKGLRKSKVDDPLRQFGIPQETKI